MHSSGFGNITFENFFFVLLFKLKETFSPGSTNDNEFNLLDLCNWCNGMRRYTIKSNQDIIQVHFNLPCHYYLLFLQSGNETFGPHK